MSTDDQEHGPRIAGSAYLSDDSVDWVVRFAISNDDLALWLGPFQLNDQLPHLHLNPTFVSGIGECPKDRRHEDTSKAGVVRRFAR